MGKDLNGLEKELLIGKLKGKWKVKVSDLWRGKNVWESCFKKWVKEYEEGGIEGLGGGDGEIGKIVGEGIEKRKEGYKGEMVGLGIENEGVKKKYVVREKEDGEREYVGLKMKS